MSPRIPDQRERFTCRECGDEAFHRSIGNGPIDHADGTRRQFKVVRCELCGAVCLCVLHMIAPGMGDSYLDRIEYFPPLRFRATPDWYASLDPDYRSVLDEVHLALDHGLFNLASTGVRTALDRLLVQEVGDSGTFKSKVTKLVDEKIITEQRKELLLTVIDAGSASAHRGFAPDAELMASIMDIAEHIFYSICVAGDHEKALLEKARQLRDSTPPRPK